MLTLFICSWIGLFSTLNRTPSSWFITNDFFSPRITATAFTLVWPSLGPSSLHGMGGVFAKYSVQAVAWLFSKKSGLFFGISRFKKIDSHLREKAVVFSLKTVVFSLKCLLSWSLSKYPAWAMHLRFAWLKRAPPGPCRSSICRCGFRFYRCGY